MTQHSDARGGHFGDRPVVIALVTACLSLTLIEYVGARSVYYDHFSRPTMRYDDLRSFVWWVGWRVFAFVVLPLASLVAIRIGTRGQAATRIRDLHLDVPRSWRQLRPYAAMFVAVLPVIVVASRLASFRTTYPFYRFADRSALDFVLWELLYGVQFVALEFFFRGYLLAMVGRRYGPSAVAVTVVPYCTLHFGKPFPETLGAIVAGFVLGHVALKSRSIWGGAVVHLAVAFTMDVLALGLIGS